MDILRARCRRLRAWMMAHIMSYGTGSSSRSANPSPISSGVGGWSPKSCTAETRQCSAPSLHKQCKWHLQRESLSPLNLDVLVGRGLAWLQGHQTCPLGVPLSVHLHRSCLACRLPYILVCQHLRRASLCAALLARPETATCAAPSHLLTPQIAPL